MPESPFAHIRRNADLSCGRLGFAPRSPTDAGGAPASVLGINRLNDQRTRPHFGRAPQLWHNANVPRFGDGLPKPETGRSLPNNVPNPVQLKPPRGNGRDPLAQSARRQKPAISNGNRNNQLAQLQFLFALRFLFFWGNNTLRVVVTAFRADCVRKGRAAALGARNNGLRLFVVVRAALTGLGIALSSLRDSHGQTPLRRPALNKSTPLRKRPPAR